MEDSKCGTCKGPCNGGGAKQVMLKSIDPIEDSLLRKYQKCWNDASITTSITTSHKLQLTTVVINKNDILNNFVEWKYGATCGIRLETTYSQQP